MRPRSTQVVLAITMVSAMCGARASIRAQSGKTVWDGVYSTPQLQRGRALYDERCASCHGAALNGLDVAPALAGGAFQSNWTGLTVGDLAERIRLSMPQGNEGSLSRQQVSDVIAAIFAVNEYPAAQVELPKELELLKQIQIAARKP